MEQHDTQELCRVLFEAIEHSLHELEENFLNHLYQGMFKHAVKCLECNYESERSDSFLDLQIPVRSDFEKIYNTSLEMGFLNYLRQEKLVDTNQYFCSKCEKKVDALKYSKFVKLPQILFLQLNRFEYDYLTESRRKICDRVTFPMILDMNDFLLSDFEQINKIYNKEHLNFLEKREGEFTEFENPEDYARKLEEHLKKGEYVYELYTVIVHAGSARGGHYYSYIKSFEDNKWYRFDDDCVYESDYKNLANAFGESTKNRFKCCNRIYSYV